MRIVLAPDSFKGSALAVEAVEALARGWRSVRPDDEIHPGNRGLHDLVSVDLGSLRPWPAGGSLLLGDVDAPLLGARGAAAVFAPRRRWPTSSTGSSAPALSWRTAPTPGRSPGLEPSIPRATPAPAARLYRPPPAPAILFATQSGRSFRPVMTPGVPPGLSCEHECSRRDLTTLLESA